MAKAMQVKEITKPFWDDVDDPPDPPLLYRVQLPQCQLLVEGRLQDHLDVEACDEAEAWEKFKAYSGIIRSDYRPAIHLRGSE